MEKDDSVIVVEEYDPDHDVYLINRLFRDEEKARIYMVTEHAIVGSRFRLSVWTIT